MVTTDENGILQDLEREERIIARQGLLKRLWKLQGRKGERDKLAKPAKGHPVVAADSVQPNHNWTAPPVSDTNLNLGTAD